MESKGQPTATTRLTISLDAELVREVRQVAGPRGISRLVNATVRWLLRSIRLREAEEELTARYGPIPDEVKWRVEALDWPH